MALFNRRPEPLPPSFLATIRGKHDFEGAEIALTNVFAENGVSNVTPDEVATVCNRYGIPAEKHDQVTYSLLRVTIQRCLSRGVLSEEGKRVIPALAAALSISRADADKVIVSEIRGRKRAAEKRRKKTEASTAGAATESSANLPTVLACNKCGSQHLHTDTKGYGLGTAAAGLVLLGPLGLLGGVIGSKDVTVTCLACGHRWTVTKRRGNVDT